MSALPPKAPATAPFSDAFGYRVLGFDKKSGDRLEMLRLRPQLASSTSFEGALRERQRRLTDFRHPAFARVRQIDRPTGQTAALAVVSNHFEGVRLSDLLKVIEAHDIRLDLVSALCMLRQVASAIARLHECGDDIALGALNPERLVVAPNGRVIVTEYMLGAALEGLALTRQQVWQDYRVALPSAAAPARMDHAADIYQLGYVGLTLVSGRSLYERQYPPALNDRLLNVEEIVLEGRAQALHPAVRTWLGRALWIDQVPFVTADEAQTALDETIATAALMSAPDVIVDLLERCYAAAPELRPKDATPAADGSAVAPAASSVAPLEVRAESWMPPAPPASWTGETDRSLVDDPLAPAAYAPVVEDEAAPPAIASLLVDAQSAGRGEPPAGERHELTLRAEPPSIAELANLPLPAEAPLEEPLPRPAAKAWVASHASVDHATDDAKTDLKPESPRAESMVFGRLTPDTTAATESDR